MIKINSDFRPSILVSGLINYETTLKIDRFPLEYYPVTYPFWGVNSTISGVGFNVAKALKTLGAETRLLSLTGADIVSGLVDAEMKKCGLGSEFIVRSLEKTPQSVILFDQSGKRQIHVDLKDIQAAVYPAEIFLKAAVNADILVLCNINFSRPLLSAAGEIGKTVACDVHAVSSADDDYNSDFMRCSDILFLSDENIGSDVQGFMKRLYRLYSNEIIVAGMGSNGALLYVKKDGAFRHFEAVHTRPVVNTIGAGDALFSAFIYFYAQTRDPYLSMEYASAFASWKVGANGGAEGFLTENDLAALCAGRFETRT
ncbi:MAG: sugar kinase [Candidatus Wallbacteria bacterium GWC2_49_35]|uniref:Sugar kinase n=1 Tax=Candidatus Wallbacteria bacterium GWC2_49_35 TaxID=1817813 RepID=A0A1F7WM35_9BACT|nr:MAG: sugar kinase [Candidatus Wallbacteria bacterium GWC2_49_35]HBC76913.1 carbohydrate kinase family protein [Candidatus Wallbacteria bacterium]